MVIEMNENLKYVINEYGYVICEKLYDKEYDFEYGCCNVCDKKINNCESCCDEIEIYDEMENNCGFVCSYKCLKEFCNKYNNKIIDVELDDYENEIIIVKEMKNKDVEVYLNIKI